MKEIEDLTRVLMYNLIYETSWRKEIKCEYYEHFIAFARCFLNSIIQEHEC